LTAQATDGSLNVTVVDGTTWVGRIAKDGSLNVFQVDGSTWTGRNHTSGAVNVVVIASGEYDINNKCGAVNVSVSPYITGTQRVTVVSGEFV